MKNSKYYLVIYLTFLLAPQVRAEYPITILDFAQLPPYCSTKMKAAAAGDKMDAETKKQDKYWSRKLEGGYGHIHHYCEGLHDLNRAYYLKEPFKSRALKTLIGGVDYVLKQGSANFILIPEMHTKKAEAYILLGQQQNAVNELNIAINVNPKYTPAYYQLSRIYLGQNQKTEAANILKKGLEANPNSKLLKKKLAKIE